MTKRQLQKIEAERQLLKLVKETDLKNQIISYFKTCADTNVLPQKAGLLIQLGLSRDQWVTLTKEFPTLATRADHFIEKIWVEKLLESNATGAMFYLKNTFKELYSESSRQDITLRIPKPILEGVEPIALPPNKNFQQNNKSV